MMKLKMYNPFLQWLRAPVWEEANEGAGGSAVSKGAVDPDQESAEGVEDTEGTEGKETTEGTEGTEAAEGKEEKDPDSTPEPITLEAITLPEGFEIAEEQQEAFLSVLNDADLSRADMVNKLIEMQANMGMNNAENLQAAITDQWQNTQREWQSQLAALPEIGGERLDETLAEVKTGMEAAGATKEVFDALDVTGAGNHPQIVQFLHKVTAGFREGAAVTTKPAESKVSRAEKMYPSMSKG